jgi:outer membrane receptor protein involved in Fe transport
VGWLAGLLCILGLGASLPAAAGQGPGFRIAPDGTLVFEALPEAAAPPAPPGADAGDPDAGKDATGGALAEDGPAESGTGAASGATTDASTPGPAAPAGDTGLVETGPDGGAAAGAAGAAEEGDAAAAAAIGDAAAAAAEAAALATEVAAEAEASAAEPPAAATALQEIEVVGRRPRLITPLPGVVLEEGAATANIQVATGEEIQTSGAIAATQFLNERMQSVTVRDTTGNPFQQELVFRGFTASPMAAAPQGLSIYLDGVRVNEPFGQVVNWDLIPLNAIESLALVPGSNPLFGLNTIGGALSLTTRSGFSSPGVDVSETQGSFGRTQTQFLAGLSDEHVAGLLSFNRLREDGWRRDSPSEVGQAFGRADLRRDGVKLTLQGLHVDNSLFGAGLIPAEDALRDPRQVYTAPDSTLNRLNHIWGNLQLDLTDTFTATALAYHRASDQTNRNGDFWDDWIEAGAGRVPACTDSPNPADRPGFINGAMASIFPDTRGVSECIPNGVVNQGLTRQKGHGAALQINWVTEQNQLVAGATWDRDQSFFRQEELLGFIDAARRVVIDPSRRFRDGPLEAGLRGFIDAFGGIGPTLDFLRMLIETGTPSDRRAAEQALPLVEAFGEVGHIPISTVFSPVEEAVLRNRARGRNESTAAFFHDVFSITPQLNVSFGARWSLTRVQVRTENDLPIPLYQFVPGFRPDFTGECPPGRVPDPQNYLTCIEEPAYEYQAFNPAVGFAWQFTEGFGLFGNLSRGNRTPSAIELACANPDEEFLREFLETTGVGMYVGCTIPAALGNDPFLEQVRSITYEFGGRGSFDSLAGRLGWNFTAYQTDSTNDILFIALGIANRGVFENFGETRRRGVEFGLRGANERLDWFLNYAWIEATFQSRARIINLSNSSSARRTIGDDLEGGFFVEPGDIIPGVPQHAVRLGASWRATPKLTLSLQALGQSWAYVRGNENNRHQPGGSDTAPPITPGEVSILTRRDTEYVGEGAVAGFAIFNLDASYRFTERLSAFMLVDNILDHRFNLGGQLGRNAFPSIFPTTPPLGAFDPSGFSNNSNDWTHSTFVAPGAPRAFWVGLRFRH